ncbi:glutamate--cysteine ligase [Ottowia sp.]|jgi:glutamate--cysteine ligase|uniref:glutamate--cysteine ligase n=1 Tax=Ottowia sp. TaxID=1898956 RepID=UPI0025DDD17A|nr:glutamate--cysteine ligase [Ottowia sp.]MBK6614729.1 glutamate--cysteine ligase [Ottowia sp.]MBK6745814.1 glutamate--cysteine ligase [Ottowia sp.]
MVPHLITALTGPINELEQRILDATPVIERWFRLEWMEHTPPLYCSVDIRNAGFKLAPVDTNLYPDGWHNLSPEMLPLAVQAAQAAIEKICPEARNLLIVPENGKPSSFYLASLARLREIFRMAGLNVRFGSIDPALKRAAALPLPDGDKLTLEPAQRLRYRVGLKNFDPCTILLNNDLAAGAPGILEELHEQYLLPPLQAGWSVRRKSRHFQCYEEVSKRFGKLLGIDPWLINPMYATCGEIDIHEPSGGECLRTNVDALLGKLRRKYKEYGINEKPFVVVKADHGTRGMGIMTVRDVKDLAQLGRKLPPGKDATQVPRGEVIIQEGVLTNERIHDAVAEPVVYMIDRYVVGGFYRVHAERGTDENLNAPGERFVPLAFAGGAQLPRPGARGEASAPNRFYMYGVIGRLAMVAASYELEATDPELQALD